MKLSHVVPFLVEGATELRYLGGQMKAARVLQFGPPSVIENDELPRPEPADGQLLIRVKAAGVGPWDALIREGKSGIQQHLPLILGSELSGVIDTVGGVLPDLGKVTRYTELPTKTSSERTPNMRSLRPK